MRWQLSRRCRPDDGYFGSKWRGLRIKRRALVKLHHIIRDVTGAYKRLKNGGGSTKSRNHLPCWFQKGYGIHNDTSKVVALWRAAWTKMTSCHTDKIIHGSGTPLSLVVFRPISKLKITTNSFYAQKKEIHLNSLSLKKVMPCLTLSPRVYAIKAIGHIKDRLEHIPGKQYTVVCNPTLKTVREYRGYYLRNIWTKLPALPTNNGIRCRRKW